MKKVKGSITVMLTMISLSLVMLATVFFDAIRIIETVNKATDSITLAAMSADSSYNHEIFEDLDIVVYQDNYELIKNVTYGNLNNGDSMCLDTDVSISTSRFPLAGYHMNNIYNKIDNYVRYIDKDGIPVCERLNGLPVYYSDNIYDGMIEILYNEDNIKALEKYCDGKNFYELVFDLLEDMGSVDSRAYQDRYFNNIMNWCIGTERSAEDFAVARNDYNIEEELSNAYDYGKIADENGSGFKWFKNSVTTIYDKTEYLYEMLKEFVQYSKKHYHTYADGVYGKTGLMGEMEYLLYGYKTDRENIAKVVSEVFKLRLFSNLRSVVWSGKVESKEALMTALNESYYDVICLLKGASVRWNKELHDFKTLGLTSLEEVRKIDISTKKVDGELTYTDFLENQFFLSCYSGMICCNETFYAHFLDLLEYAYGQSADSYSSYGEITCEISFSEDGRESAFSTLGKIIMDQLTYTRIKPYGL